MCSNPVCCIPANGLWYTLCDKVKGSCYDLWSWLNFFTHMTMTTLWHHLDSLTHMYWRFEVLSFGKAVMIGYLRFWKQWWLATETFVRPLNRPNAILEDEWHPTVPWPRYARKSWPFAVYTLPIFLLAQMCITWVQPRVSEKSFGPKRTCT